MYMYMQDTVEYPVFYIYSTDIPTPQAYDDVHVLTHPTHNSARPSKKKFTSKAANNVPLILTHNTYGLAIIGLFCRISSLLQGSFAKETHKFNDFNNTYALVYHIHNLPTPHTHPTRNFTTRTTTFSINMAAQNFLLILTHHTYDIAHVHIHNYTIF